MTIVFASLVCFAMAADCARIAISEKLAAGGGADALHRAVRLWPHRSDYYRHLAVLEPEHAGIWFGKALELNPRDTRTWLRMGLQAEADGQLEEAERALLQAARLDGTFEPRWTLANFYFRTNDTARLWHWAREAARLGRDDLTPLFDLCWRTRPDVDAMLRDIVPAACTPQRNFFEYLSNNQAAAQAITVSAKMQGCTDPQTRLVLSQFTNSLLFEGNPDDARKIWNGLVASGAFPFREVDPSRGWILSNGSFERFPSKMGFDWHFDPVDGVIIDAAPGANGLRMTFDGSEPDAFAVLYQPVILQSKTAYRLTAELASTVPEGFNWRLADLRTGAPAIHDGDDLAGPASARHWQFRSTGLPAYALALVYQRPSGSTRFQGAIQLRRVEVTTQ